MTWLAFKMLLGNRAKYGAMLFGITFASLLICQQLSIFCGVMRMTDGQIRDVEDADVWVLAPNVRYIDDLRPLSEQDLDRVRSVAGVAWAEPLQKTYGRIYLNDGHFQQVILMALDDVTLAGAPRDMRLGRLENLEEPDAIVLDEDGYHMLWPGEPLRLGRVVTLNERRAVIAGVCKVAVNFQTLPVVYVRRSLAAQYLPPDLHPVSAVLVRGEEGVPPEEVCRRIHEATGLLALTWQEFSWRTMEYYLENTGLLLNFGTTVFLGFMVGVAISGQTFYTFTVENLPQFGMLKAMGVTNRRLVKMILLQAVTVGSIGYGVGVGLAAIFGELSQGRSKLVFFMPWQVLVLTGVAVLVVTMSVSLLSIRRVLRLEPAIVIR